MDTKELIKNIHLLEIKTKLLTKHLFSGEYHSAFKGKGMAFSDVRDYQYGDEVRTIDWNVTARYNTPFVKTFEEERELTMMLVIDVSGSQLFGTQKKTKKQLAIEIVAVLAFSALANNDKVGALFVSDTVEKYIPAQKGKKHILLILKELMAFKTKNQKTDLNEGLRFLRNTQKKRSVTFVISDFLDQNDFIESLKLTNKRHDTIAIHLEDDAEKNLPDMGIIQLFNAETQHTTWVNTSSEKVRSLFQKQKKQSQTLLLDQFKKAGIDTVVCNTNEDFIKPLVQLFHKRA